MPVIVAAINVPTAQQAQRIGNMFCQFHGYQETLPDPTPENPAQTKPNPETKAQFVNRKMREYLRDCVKAQEGQIAAEAARVTAVNDVDAIPIT